MLSDTLHLPPSPITTFDVRSFLSMRAEVRDWFGDHEQQQAKKYLELQTLLEDSLDDLKGYRAGETLVDIVIAGLDRNGMFAGVRTQAVET